MNFLKNNKKIIAAFAAGAIIFSGVGYAANEYLAGNIRYTKSGASSSISVAEALNELYEMKKNYVLPSGTLNITENGNNIDVKQYEKVNVNVSLENKGVTWNMGKITNTIGVNSIYVGFSPKIFMIIKDSTGKGIYYLKDQEPNKFIYSWMTGWYDIDKNRTDFGLCEIGESVKVNVTSGTETWTWYAVK